MYLIIAPTTPAKQSLQIMTYLKLAITILMLSYKFAENIAALQKDVELNLAQPPLEIGHQNCCVKGRNQQSRGYIHA